LSPVGFVFWFSSLAFLCHSFIICSVRVCLCSFSLFAFIFIRLYL
jgi:hypothetical protein